MNTNKLINHVNDQMKQHLDQANYWQTKANKYDKRTKAHSGCIELARRHMGGWAALHDIRLFIDNNS